MKTKELTGSRPRFEMKLKEIQDKRVFAEFVKDNFNLLEMGIYGMSINEHYKEAGFNREMFYRPTNISLYYFDYDNLDIEKLQQNTKLQNEPLPEIIINEN